MKGLDLKIYSACVDEVRHRAVKLQLSLSNSP
ncbi:hypothetical protein LPU83_pLPU83c_0587 (plasmid) [Rhizobium favelukesii]|uniref:Uncharacterized protein n=1 Tax=Rhizobium favelukesii TaxID=348824 RepID=W6RJV9_9HYPH|nr:hypothetical protein LPU83_pLPU83c_0587 [Rhizobium favelukesii]